MAVSLIGFLGRGPYALDGQRRDYFKTKYQFSDWTSNQVSFFLHALLDWLRQQRGQAPDRVIVLGTAGSMWDNLLMTFGPETDHLERVWQDVASQVDRQALTVEDLKVVAKLVTEGLGVEVHAELVPPGKTPAEQAHILAVLQKHVKEGDQVFFDVTHGYRHQPILGLGAAVLLTRLRRAHIEEIFYGASEMRDSISSAPAPVVSLRWVLDLIDWAGSIEQVCSGGRLRALTRVVHDPTLQESLADTAFRLATNQVRQAGEKANDCLAALAATAADPILELTRPAIQEALEAVAGCRRDGRGILVVARSALGQQDYVRTAILLCEAVRKHERTFGKTLDRRQVGAIKDLRNALVHAAPPRRPEIREALKYRSRMEKTLREQLDWLEAQLSGASPRRQTEVMDGQLPER